MMQKSRESEVPDETRGSSRIPAGNQRRRNQLWFVQLLFLNLGDLLKSIQRDFAHDVPCEAEGVKFEARTRGEVDESRYLHPQHIVTIAPNGRTPLKTKAITVWIQANRGMALTV